LTKIIFLKNHNKKTKRKEKRKKPCVQVEKKTMRGETVPIHSVL